MTMSRPRSEKQQTSFRRLKVCCEHAVACVLTAQLMCVCVCGDNARKCHIEFHKWQGREGWAISILSEFCIIMRVRGKANSLLLRLCTRSLQTCRDNPKIITSCAANRKPALLYFDMFVHYKRSEFLWLICLAKEVIRFDLFILTQCK